MQRMFDRSPTGLEASRELLRLRQGHNTISDFAIDFQTLATDSGWEGRALLDAFLHGLAEPVKDELLMRDLPDDLERITANAIRVDARLEDRRRATLTKSPPPRRHASRRHRYPPSPPRGESEALMVDRSRVSREVLCLCVVCYTQS